MVGSIRWNLAIACFAAILSMLLSFLNGNVLLSVATSGFYSFIVLFIVMFILRWLLAFIVAFGDFPAQTDSHMDKGDVNVGRQIDLSTPEEDQSFIPFEPPRHMEKDSNSNSITTEQLTDTVRRWTED